MVKSQYLPGLLTEEVCKLVELVRKVLCIVLGQAINITAVIVGNSAARLS